MREAARRQDAATYVLDHGEGVERREAEPATQVHAEQVRGQAHLPRGEERRDGQGG